MSTKAGKEEDRDEFDVDEDGFFFFFEVEVPLAEDGASGRLGRTGEVVAELVDFFGGAAAEGLLLEFKLDVEVDGADGLGRGWKVVDGEAGLEDEVEEEEEVGRFGFNGCVDAVLR